MNKKEFETHVKNWLISFIGKNDEMKLIEIFEGKNISRLSHEVLDKMPQSKMCDFICDFVALVEHKSKGNQLIFANRHCKSVGLKDIGEMLIYSKIADPLHSFLISTHGHSTEINKILANEKLSNPLFFYGEKKNIVLFVLGKEVKLDSVLPIISRSIFI